MPANFHCLWLAPSSRACKVLPMANASESLRQVQLSEFASQYLPQSLVVDIQENPSPLPGDAGFRRYYRWQSCPEVLGVDAPPETEDSLAFVRIADLLRSLGVHSPTVFAANLHQGLLLVENLGENSYQDGLSAENTAALYARALDALLKMQCCAERPAWLPLYGEAQLRQEMSLFPTWFVEQLLGYPLSVEEEEQINQVFDWLIQMALDQPQVLVHRDYHCRNLILTADNCPGVIDFQDAVWGPVTYDLVSLMRDCYVRWQPARVEAELESYLARLADQGVILEHTIPGLHRNFDAMGLQRHIKVLGIFSRLWLRDGKPGYLADLPLVMRYVLEVAGQLEQTRDFADWMQNKLVPLAQQQDWYRGWRQAGDDKTLW